MLSTFLKKTLIFLVPLFLFPIAIFVTDPFDFLGNPLKVNLDRIHIVRRLNVADWALSEVSKIDIDYKSRFRVVSIGDSRGRALFSGGFEKGWMGRINGVNHKNYDLSFGGAQLDESISFLNKEIEFLDSLETIVISLPIDRILSMNEHVNRIENSQFNSKTPKLKYLLNFKQLTYLFYPKAENGNKKKGLLEQEKMQKQFLSIYNTTNRKTFDQNLDRFLVSLNKLKFKYKIIIIIPPYENIFFKKILKDYSEDYNYFINKLSSTMLKDSIQIINLQNIENEFYFIDPVHCFLKTGNIIDLLISNKKIISNKGLNSLKL